MRIALGGDHAGYALKELVKGWLAELGHEVRDFGCHDDSPVDYPDFVIPAAQSVARGEADRAIVLGGSGNGEAMAANKVPGIRCALCWDVTSARLSRQHNDANALAIGARIKGTEVARDIVSIWLTTPFDGGRHERRIAKIHALEGTVQGRAVPTS